MNARFLVAALAILSLVACSRNSIVGKAGSSVNNFSLLSKVSTARIMDDPKALLDILRADEQALVGDKDSDYRRETLELSLKHQALMRLLEIQGEHFSGNPTPAASEGVGIDHLVVSIEEIQQGGVTILATPQWIPIQEDTYLPGETYYVLELMKFDVRGKLLERLPYRS